VSNQQKVSNNQNEQAYEYSTSSNHSQGSFLSQNSGTQTRN
jgi:hypothetical protein